MDKIVRKLYLIENIALRLKALAGARGLPENSVNQMLDECAALFWANKELNKLYLFNVMLIVGDSRYLHTLTWLDDGHFNDFDGLSSYIEFAPSSVILDKTREYLAPNWDGNVLSSDKTPSWLFCKKYYASCEKHDPTQRAVLLDCSTPKQWLEETGRSKAKEIIEPWMYGFFKAIKWDSANVVSGSDSSDISEDELS